MEFSVEDMLHSTERRVYRTDDVKTLSAVIYEGHAREEDGGASIEDMERTFASAGRRVREAALLNRGLLFRVNECMWSSGLLLLFFFRMVVGEY